MPNITAQNPIRYCIDNLSDYSQGVLISDSFAFDLSEVKNISALNLDYSQPSDTQIFLLFNINNIWGTLSSNGFNQIEQQNISFDTLKNYGNTPAQIKSLSNFSALAGNRVRIAVGLASSNPSNAVPKIKISASCSNSSQVLNFSKLSSLYDLDNSQIISASNTPSVSGSGSVNVLAQITYKDGNVSTWQNVNNFIGQYASKIQFRADYSVSDLSSSASVKNISLVYASSTSQIIETEEKTNYSQLFSITQDWHMNIKSCRLTLKHSPCENSSIKAFAAFRPKPKEIFHEKLGIGSGSKKIYQLANTNNIQYDSVKLFFDGQQTFSNFEINTIAGRVTVNAPEGVIITCSYSYDWQNEIWQEMTENYSISYPDYDQTEFHVDALNSENSMCAIKFIMDAQTGHISSENIGKGSGLSQTYKLSHRVKDGSISIYENTSLLSSKYFSLHDDAQYISVAASQGKNIFASYDWQADFPKIYQFAAVFYD